MIQARRPRTVLSKTELNWLQKNSSKPIKDYHRDFCAKFSRSDLSERRLQAVRRRNGWKTSQGDNLRRSPVGHERLNDRGYRFIVIEDEKGRREVRKHVWLWEKIHGPIPAGMVLKCKGDHSNSEPSNWVMVPRGILAKLNNRAGHFYDEAPDVLKPTVMAIAKLRY
jgi:hypothetical protein